MGEAMPPFRTRALPRLIVSAMLGTAGLPQAAAQQLDRTLHLLPVLPDQSAQSLPVSPERSAADPSDLPLGLKNAPGLGAPPASGPQTPAPEPAPAAPPPPEWRASARLRLSERLTDNADLRSADHRHESVTELTPGVHLEGRSARLKMTLDYAATRQYYARTPELGRTLNALNTFGTFDAFDKWFFLDFSGVIAQQAISAFGTQSADPTAYNANYTETATYRLAPYIKGELGSSADYLLRHNKSMTRVRSGQVSDIDQSETLAQIQGESPLPFLRWKLEGNSLDTRYLGGRRYAADSVRATLTQALTPQFRILVKGGAEANDYVTEARERKTIGGMGFEWSPTDRTRVSAFGERRYFGNGYNAEISHRLPRSSIQYLSSRDVAILPNRFVTVGLGSLYDLYYQQFANLIPDPAERSIYVNNLLSQAGLSPDAQAVGSFLASRPSLQRRQQLTAIWFGSRDTLTLMGSYSENQLLTIINGLQDDLSRNSVIQQLGFMANYSHRLSPLSNLNLLGARQRSEGNGTGIQTSTSVQIGITTQLGPKTTGAINLRRNVNENPSSAGPITDNSLQSSLSVAF